MKLLFFTHADSFLFKTTMSIKRVLLQLFSSLFLQGAFNFLIFTTFLFSAESPKSIDHAVISMYAVDATTGAVILDHNSSLSLMPSSCIKLFTTAAALELIEENYRFKTDLEYDGSIDSRGNLKGNLYIKGGGDPCLGSDRISSSLGWKKQIESWVKAIRQAGIKSIEGKLIADVESWEKTRTIPSWEWEDLGNYYGAGASALSFHENFYFLTFKPGKRVGDRTTILRTDPPLESLHFENDVTTGPEGSGDCASIYGSELSLVQRLQGTVPLKIKEFTIKGSLPDPGYAVIQLLTKGLDKQGIPIKQTNKEQQLKRTLIQSVYSPSIQEIVYQTNQKSINLYAEHLLKKIGETTLQQGSTKAGLEAIMQFCESKGIELTGFNMVDGSGLSRKNLVTTKQLVALLLEMKKSPCFPSFFASLPEIKKGIHAKSGSMTLNKGYAGYAGNKVFAILINNCPDRNAVNQKIEEFLLALMNTPSTHN